jgi:hypothetical protein
MTVSFSKHVPENFCAVLPFGDELAPAVLKSDLATGRVRVAVATGPGWQYHVTLDCVSWSSSSARRCPWPFRGRLNDLTSASLLAKKRIETSYAIAAASPIVRLQTTLSIEYAWPLLQSELRLRSAWRRKRRDWRRRLRPCGYWLARHTTAPSPD